MKILRYFTECKILSTDENGDAVSSTALCEVETPWSEANGEIAKKEAHNGEYTIEDDGQPELETEASTDDVLNAMLGVM